MQDSVSTFEVTVHARLCLHIHTVLCSHAACCTFQDVAVYQMFIQTKTWIHKVKGGESRGAHLFGGTSNMGSSLGIRIKPPISPKK